MQIVRFPTGPDIDVAAARSAGFVIKGADNLEIVEGIGPRIAQLLRADGITTFAEVAAALVARIQGVLDRGGPSFKLAKPEPWPCGGLSQVTSVGEGAGQWLPRPTRIAQYESGVVVQSCDIGLRCAWCPRNYFRARAAEQTAIDDRYGKSGRGAPRGSLGPASGESMHTVKEPRTERGLRSRLLAFPA